MDITHSTFAILVTVIVMVHLKAMEFVYRTGTDFYTLPNNKCKNTDEVWDIIHMNFKNYSQYNYTKNWYMVLFAVPLIHKLVTDNIKSDFFKEFILKFLIIIFLRSLTIMATILPKNTPVEVIPDEYGNLSLFDKTIGGGCYDKMFSGHFAFGLLLTLLMFKYEIIETNALNIGLFSFLNILHLFILGVTRSHYTMDMIVSLYVTLFVYNLDINLI
jgi:hypothetical protein